MIGRKKVLFASLVFTNLAFFSPVFGLNEPTHRIVNDQATNTPALDLYLQQNLGFSRGLDEKFQGQSVLAWVGEGGIREDEGVRFFNHFHDPLRPWGSAGLSSLFGSNPSSIRWMQNANSGWSWQNARDYYWTALTATTQAARDRNFADTFRALGQVMHLVVDASVPEHVRNDPHPAEGICRTIIGIGCFGNYEYWVSDSHGVSGSAEEGDFIFTYLSNPVGFDPNILQQPTNDSAAPVPVARLIDTDTYTGAASGPNVTLSPAIGIGEFANANFFSEDTISGAYPFPNVSALVPSQVSPPGTGKVFRYYAKGTGDGIANDVAAAECILDQAARDQGIFSGPTYFCVDETVWSRTAQVMLPRAVGYARGVLDYFFRNGLKGLAMDMGCGFPPFPNPIELPQYATFGLSVANVPATALTSGEFATSEAAGPGRIVVVVHYKHAGRSHYFTLLDTMATLEAETGAGWTIDMGQMSQVPAGATEIYFTIAYRGPFGQETDAVIGGIGRFDGLC
jgi:hypothetical protein